jgi:hypothetical protein
MILSACSVGNRVWWQDDGFYICAVKELGILYPHGFVLFLLLCKAWTLLLFFIPLTLAVHLFTAACAAGAAGALGAAARDLLQTNGPVFKVSDQEPSETAASWIGAAVGSLGAVGYTFWFAALYSKSLSLLYLILALLLGRMIRADREPSRRNFRIVALLVGVAWQAHPSAALIGIALVLFIARHRAALGVRGILSGIGLAAAIALGPSLLLPILATRDTTIAFAQPTTFRSWLPYLTGSRFTSVPGAFGFDGGRLRNIAGFFWEEALGGSILMLVGIVRLVRVNPRLLLGLGCWVVPNVLVTALYKLEGHPDLWLVSSWLVLWLAAGVGLNALVENHLRLVRPIAGTIAAVAVAWGVGANGPDLCRRGYDYPEIFGRLHLEPVEPGSIVILISDDATAITRHLQLVDGVRRDVVLLHETELEDGVTGQPSFYLERVQRRKPYLHIPDFRTARARFPGVLATYPGVIAFLNANADLIHDHPIYLQRAPANPGLLRDDLDLVPVGVLLKVVRKGEEPKEEGRWSLPMEPGTLRFRRERAQAFDAGPQGLRVAQESFELRLHGALTKVRRAEADYLFRKNSFERAAAVYTMLREVDPRSRGDRTLALALVACKFRLGRGAEGLELLEALLRSDPVPELHAEAACLRGEILRSLGRQPEAERSFHEALTLPGLDPAKRADLERRAKTP